MRNIDRDALDIGRTHASSCPPARSSTYQADRRCRFRQAQVLLRRSTSLSSCSCSTGSQCIQASLVLQRRSCSLRCERRRPLSPLLCDRSLCRCPCLRNPRDCIYSVACCCFEELSSPYHILHILQVVNYLQLLFLRCSSPCIQLLLFVY